MAIFNSKLFICLPEGISNILQPTLSTKFTKMELVLQGGAP